MLAAANGTISTPNSLLQPVAAPNNTLTTEGTQTDVDTIVSTVQIVDQKTGAASDVPPDQPPPPTTVTAVDGDLTNSTVPASSSDSARRSSGLARRLLDGYKVAFEGTGTGPTDRDGSIEGTAYLTYTVVPNNTYSVDDCLSFCDRVDGCGKLPQGYWNFSELTKITYSVSLRKSVLRIQQPTA